MTSPAPKESAPLVSVILPLYESHATLERCLRALASQSFRDFEVVLTDSSPHEKCREIARSEFPSANYVNVGRRMRSQEARNVGARRARGSLWVFIDPDSYPPPGWLGALVQSAQRGRTVVLGPIACHGQRWLDRGVHLCKFNVCLPLASLTVAPLGWSGNVLIAPSAFEAAGGWDTSFVQGDTLLTARLRALGHTLWVEPGAVVEHDHERVGFGAFLRERYGRGGEYASVEARLGESSAAEGSQFPRLRSLVDWALLPARVAHRLVYIGGAARRARLLGDYVSSFPVILSGVSAWYVGMASGRLARRRAN